MKKAVTLFLLLVIAQLGIAQGAVGDIIGRIFESPESDSPAAFAKVWVERGNTKFGTSTDENGRFTINAIPIGVYELNINYFGDTIAQKIYANVIADGIDNVGRINFFDEKVTIVEGGEVVAFQHKLIDHGDVGVRRIDALDIAKSSAKHDIKTLIASRNSDIFVNDNGDMMIRGSRPNDLINYIDGVKTGTVRDIPSAAIGSITIYTNAIPAKYGDCTGGVIIMETKSYYDLYRAWKIQQTFK